MRTKKEKRSRLLKTVVIGGMIAGASSLSANAGDLLNYGDLGSGSELRSDLLEQYGSPVSTANLPSDYIVGEAKCGEGKCGEGKEKTKEKKGKEAKTAKKGETKTSEAKCGEGKCGEGKSNKKEAKKKETKTGEGKCGEGKCGS
jgi:uncharacterized low-complexity protein